MTNQEAIKKVKESPSSIFLKDDVLLLIESIKQEEAKAPDQITIDVDALESHIISHLKSSLIDEDFFDLNEIRYGIDNYNTVYAEDIPIKYSTIGVAIHKAIQSFIDKNKKP